MAWEWSHSPEAYDNGCLNLEDKIREELEVIYAEWQVWKWEEAERRKEEEEWEADDTEEDIQEELSLEEETWDSVYSRALEESKELSKEILAGYTWARAEELRTCDNGGWNLWVCPYGCHTVSCDREEEEE